MKTLVMAAIGMAAALVSMDSSGAARFYPLVITAPVNGTVVAPGQSVTITVTVASGYTYPNGVAMFGGQDDGAAVMVGPQSSLTFSVTIPTNANSGPLTLTASGTDSSGTLDNSATITVDVEQPSTSTPVSLRVDPPSMHFAYIGQTLPLNLIGVYANGSWQGLTQSSKLQISSANTAIATVTGGSVTSTGTGSTTLQVSYGSLTATVPVSVPNTPPP
jgi:hypothetical protein